MVLIWKVVISKMQYHIGQNAVFLSREKYIALYFIVGFPNNISSRVVIFFSIVTKFNLLSCKKGEETIRLIQTHKKYNYHG